MRVRRTHVADRDIDGILADTLTLFGERQVLRYADLIARTIDTIADNPQQAASRDQPNIGHGVRSLRLADSRLRSRRRASHRIYYVVRQELGEVVVLRVLHDRMDPLLRVLRALGDEIRRS